MKKLLLAGLGFFALSNAAMAAPPALSEMPVPPPAAGGHMPPPPPPRMPPMISVSGEAHEDFAPDQAKMSLSIVSRDPDLQRAKKVNDEMVERLVAVTREFDIPKNKVSTSRVNISPQYRYDKPSSKQVFETYVINRTLTITIEKLDIHERLLSAVVNANVDQVNNVHFSLAKPEAHMDALRLKAFADAKEKAQALAEAAGMKLGKPLSINTTGSRSPMPPMPMMRGDMMMASAPPAMESASYAPSLPGMITLQESVQVTFAME